MRGQQNQIAATKNARIVSENLGPRRKKFSAFAGNLGSYRFEKILGSFFAKVLHFVCRQKWKNITDKLRTMRMHISLTWAPNPTLLHGRAGFAPPLLSLPPIHSHSAESQTTSESLTLSLFSSTLGRGGFVPPLLSQLLATAESPS